MANTDCLFQDQSDDVPCDPGPYSRPWSVESILGSLEQACRNEFPAWALDNALLSIANRSPAPFRKPFVLDEADRDEILQALACAKALMPECIPDYPPQQFARGLDAAMVQVILWAETESERALRHRDVKADADDVARCLRNDMHTICLSERVQERLHKRQAATISAIILPFRVTRAL